VVLACFIRVGRRSNTTKYLYMCLSVRLASWVDILSHHITSHIILRYDLLCCVVLCYFNFFTMNLFWGVQLSLILSGDYNGPISKK
jgi:hypothetical protein